MIPEKKILKVWPFWIEGIKYHDQYLADEMQKDNIKTIFACPNTASNSYSNFSHFNNRKKSIEYSYEMFFLKHFSFLGKPFTYEVFKFSKFIKSYNPDIIHIFGISNFTTIITFLSVFFSNFKGKILINDHSDPNERKTSLKAKIYYLFFNLYYKLFIKKNIKIIVPDKSSKNELIFRYGDSIEKNIEIIPLGYDDNIFKVKKRNSKNLPLKIGFAGKINPLKKIDLLINAVEIFDKKEIQLDIAGINLENKSDYQEKLIEYVNDNKMTNITFKKFFTSSIELSNFYCSLDLAIFPGSISITTFEANGCGCPVIIFNSYPGLEHRVSDGRGKLFNTKNELIDYIKYYLDIKKNNSINHEKISKKSNKYSWKVIKELYYDLYNFN